MDSWRLPLIIGYWDLCISNFVIKYLCKNKSVSKLFCSMSLNMGARKKGSKWRGGGGCQFLNQYIHKHINIVSVKRNKHTVGSGGLFKGPPTQAPTLGINSSEWHLSGEKGELQLRQCYLFFKFSFFYPLEGTLKLQNLSHVWQM